MPCDRCRCGEFVLPPIEVHWHEVDQAVRGDLRFDRDGTTPLFRDAALGVQSAAEEKRLSINARVAKAADIIAGSPDDHFLIWHDLEDERRAIQKAIPESVAVWGSQDLDEREQRIVEFSDGKIKHLSTKPVIAGSGCNFQRHCHRAVFVGIGFKFADFIQAIHRIQRFQQTRPVRIDLVYTSAEREIRRRLEAKWSNHVKLVDRMTTIIRDNGLAADAAANGLHRSIGVDRQERSGDGFRVIHNDSVLETRSMPEASVGLVVTSIPFSTQYEYSPSYNDFGHNEDNATFWQQMDYLTPELVRVLQPGRVAAVHVKDRIVPGGINGLGFRTLHPFHAEAIAHYQSHGLAFLGMITVVTDVVRENNQTYRLSWTAQCKDGSPMGVGVPEYILILRKPPTDRTNGYADEPVVKDKGEYSLGRWQVDAHGFWRSNGNRHLMPEEFAGLTHAEIFRLFRDHNLTNVYEFGDHVAAADSLRAEGKLPVDFMLLQPPSWHPDVWTDVARMRTLNMIQAQKGKEQHLCPLQFDIVDRLITRYSNPGDVVLDPFGGIMTVPYCALKAGRVGWGIELNPVYWRDGVHHVEGVALQINAPSLFDLDEAAS